MQVVSKLFSCEGFSFIMPKLMSIFSWFILGFICGMYVVNRNCKKNKKEKQLNKQK
jgi:F0F1-type ATP synthase assembly protein I